MGDEGEGYPGRMEEGTVLVLECLLSSHTVHVTLPLSCHNSFISFLLTLGSGNS